KLKVGVVGEGNAFYPESSAYERYFRDNERIELKSYKSYKEADAECDVVIYYCGFIPFWRKSRSLLISEYHSLSTTKFPVVKNFLKRLLKKKGKYFIFLDERVRSGYCFFRNRKSFFYRSMGYDEEAVALAHSGAKKEYDFVYFGSVNRKGV